MEDYYGVLGVCADAPVDEIKQRYRKLLLQCYPDKVQPRDEASAEEAARVKQEAQDTFLAVQRAWSVLSDSRMRAEYDACVQLRAHAQTGPVQDEVTLSDFDREEQGYSYPCRCGEHYLLSDTDAGFRMDYCACAGCSLCVKVIYDSVKDTSDQST